MINRDELWYNLASDILPWVPTLEDCKLFAELSFNESNPYLYEKYSQLVNLNRKAVPSELPSELVSKATDHFLKVEADIATVSSLRPWLSCNWFEEVKHIIYSVLGVLDHSYQDILDSCRFGPGASFIGDKTIKHLINKIGGTQSVTHSCFYSGMFQDYVLSYPNWYNTCLYRSKLKMIAGNRVAFVPKDVSKCRQIAIEPSLNMFLQLGIGSVIQNLLLQRTSIDLRDQSRNLNFARIGSINQSCCTIDLSDASNRISTALVVDLLPADWYAALSSLRSPMGIMPDGTSHRHIAFSTQGNGFTFPLETLIFYSVAKSLQPKVLSVYGDDIIIDNHLFDELSYRLEVFGFKVNKEKSFHNGPFRESCGGDFMNGHDVRSVFYKKEASNVCDINDIHNRLIAKWSNIPKTSRYLASLIRNPSWGPRYCVSDSKGQSCNKLVSDTSRWLWAEDPSTFTDDFYYVKNSIKTSTNERARYLAFLYGGSDSVDIPVKKRCLRGSFSSSKKRSIHVFDALGVPYGTCLEISSERLDR